MNAGVSRVSGPWVPWVGVLARVILGVIYLWAGGSKLADPFDSVRAVRAFDVLPESIVPLVGYGLPPFEVALGLCLLLGLLTRPSAAISALLQVAFLIGIIQAWARGLQIDCGCFGGGGFKADAAEQYPWDIARDIGLLLLSAWLIWRPRTPFSLDGSLFGGRTRALTDAEADAR